MRYTNQKRYQFIILENLNKWFSHNWSNQSRRGKSSQCWHQRAHNNVFQTENLIIFPKCVIWISMRKQEDSATVATFPLDLAYIQNPACNVCFISLRSQIRDSPKWSCTLGLEQWSRYLKGLYLILLWNWMWNTPSNNKTV